MIRIKRVYDAFESKDGFRILVDRLWPRGLKKDTAKVDKWVKEIAPSVSLRKWFNHQPEKWQAFKHDYKEELSGNKAVAELLEEVDKNQTVTLRSA